MAADQGEKRPREVLDSARGYVRVRGLPYSATREQVRDFFATAISVELADVALRHNASGAAFVRVKAPELAAALALNKGLLGKRYLEIFETDQAEFERCESSATPDGSKTLVRMRGLPWGATKEDLTSFFEGHSIISTHILSRFDGRQTGEAYVEFDSEQSAVAAMGLQRKEMRGRYIELFESTKGEMLAVTAAHAPDGAGGIPGVGGAGLPGMEEEWRVVKVRGLPWAATAGEVTAFFCGAPGLKEGSLKSVLLLTTPDGRSAGEALVTFDSAEAASAALKRDKHQLGSRWVNVQPFSQPEMRARAGGAGGTGDPSTPAWYADDWALAHPLELPPHLSTTLHPSSRACVRVRGLQPACTEEQVGAFFRSAVPAVAPAAVRLIFKRGQPSGYAYVLFSSEQDCAQGLALQQVAQASLSAGGQGGVEFARCSVREMLLICSPPVQQVALVPSGLPFA